jgi:type I restriction enzyme R subunit
MNEAETRAELIDPKLTAQGWGVVDESRVLREYNITKGKIQTSSVRASLLKADYILEYKGVKLAVIEAKSADSVVGEGVQQAKDYAHKLQLKLTYATNGREIYEIDMESGTEGLVERFPTPEELWARVFEQVNLWRDKFNAIPFESRGGSWELRYYQEIAVNKVLEAIAEGDDRILLTLATGTGKTAIAFQIAWKLYQTRWNLQEDGGRRPRILFLADRNILANQAFNSFSAFPEDALVRIDPKQIRYKGEMPKNGSVFFTIFQTFMSGENLEDEVLSERVREYPEDYFDFIIIDECHRGGANDEGRWRKILEYFSPAVQLGLTATPKQEANADTYKYFGDSVYTYSLKDGIEDGFLTPFKVKRIHTTMDDYLYTPDDDVVEGDIETGKLYTEGDFNRKIVIEEREAYRVQTFMNLINQDEKTIVFCANQAHAALVRDLINQQKLSTNPNYCVRVTANDGEVGEQYLREFQDNEKTIPTILTTSQKLSTGVDARNVRNIVLMRPINSMIEFKQIIGRGTRVFEGKDFFTIYDFVDAYELFADPKWGVEAIGEVSVSPVGDGGTKTYPPIGTTTTTVNENKKIKVKLRDGKIREIQSMVSTSFWDAQGRPVSVEEFMHNLFGELPKLFTTEQELRAIWGSPITRKQLLEKLGQAGFSQDKLKTLQKLVDAENSDLFDVLEYVFNAENKPISREMRVLQSKQDILADLSESQKQFLQFVLDKYIQSGFEELDQDRLAILLQNKYHSLAEAQQNLGGVESIRDLFIEFQKYLYR